MLAKRFTLYLAVPLLMIAGVMLFTPAVLANDFGLSRTAGAAGLDTGTRDIPTIVGNIIGTGLSLVGVAFFVLTLYGGFLWMTAHGNDDQIKKALKIITAAVIGLVIVMASFAITTFIFRSLGTGGNEGGVCVQAGDQCAGNVTKTTCEADTANACVWTGSNTRDAETNGTCSASASSCSGLIREQCSGACSWTVVL